MGYLPARYRIFILARVWPFVHSDAQETVSRFHYIGLIRCGQINKSDVFTIMGALRIIRVLTTGVILAASGAMLCAQELLRQDVDAPKPQNPALSSRPMAAPKQTLNAFARAGLAVPGDRWLVIQPDLQFVFNPGATARLPDAVVCGARTTLSF